MKTSTVHAARLAAGLCALALAATPVLAGPPRVTVIGDSVQETLAFTGHARAVLGGGIDLRLEARACRKLAAPGCIGGAPESALSLVGRLGRGLGSVVVVNVGYNDWPGAYAVADVRSALRAAGVRRTVWVTLRESQGTYRDINAAIRSAAAARASGIQLADWDAASSGRPWFGGDGVHLTAAGAEGLAGFLHRHVVAALAEIGVPVAGTTPPVISRRVRTRYPVSGIAGDGRTLWVYGGGRLSALDERAPRRGATVPVDPAAALTPDRSGGGLWRQSGSGTLARAIASAPEPRWRSVGRFEEGAIAVSARGRTWIATRPARIRWPLPPPLLLDSRGVGAPQQPASAPAALAAGRGALWALVVDGGAARLELRDPETGRLRRSTRVPPSRALVATRGAAWLLEPSGRLRRVGAKGAVRVRLRRILAIASDSGARLWALRSDGRTVLQLDHESGRVLSLGRTAGKVSELALTRTGVWLAGPGTGRLEHIRRRER